MLARTTIAAVARSSATAAQQRSLATASATKSFQHAVATSPSAAVQAPPLASIATASPSKATAISSGELAWCEIYGVDYEQQVQEALAESPLAVNEAHRFAPSPSAVATSRAKTDIWNVVFGTASA